MSNETKVELANALNIPLNYIKTNKKSKKNIFKRLFGFLKKVVDFFVIVGGLILIVGYLEDFKEGYD